MLFKESSRLLIKCLCFFLQRKNFRSFNSSWFFQTRAPESSPVQLQNMADVLGGGQVCEWGGPLGNTSFFICTVRLLEIYYLEKLLPNCFASNNSKTQHMSFGENRQHIWGPQVWNLLFHLHMAFLLSPADFLVGLNLILRPLSELVNAHRWL